MRVTRWFSRPRMNTATSKCGAWQAARACDAAGFKGAETKRPMLVCGDAAEPAEGRRRRFVLHVVGMRVLALRIGLPDFQDCIVDRFALAIDHPAVQGDLVRGGRRRRKIAGIERRQADAEE